MIGFHESMGYQWALSDASLCVVPEESILTVDRNF